MPRPTDSDDPADWLLLAELDLGLIGLAIERELFFQPSRSKLAEALEKVLKAELIRPGWQLKKTRDLEFLAGELRARGSDLMGQIDPVITPLADAYFALACDVLELGLATGEVGAVVEIHSDDAFEVEFCNEEGCTYGLHTLRAEQFVRLHTPRPVPAHPPRSGLNCCPII